MGWKKWLRAMGMISGEWRIQGEAVRREEGEGRRDEYSTVWIHVLPPKAI